MAGAVWAVGEVVDGAITRMSTEVATVARRLADAAGRDATGVVVAGDPTGPSTELAAYIPRVLAVAAAEAERRPAAAVTAAHVAALAREARPAWIVIGATPDGRDVAGALAVMLDIGVLANALDVAWDGAAGPVVEASVLGGRVLSRSAFTADRGIVLLTPNVIAAEPAPAAGVVEVAASGAVDVTAVAVVDHVAAPAEQVPIEEARVIVAGGRGVGSPEGFGIVAELAELLGGSVGATRAAVDAGWIDYAHQVGQTGKSVRPALYLALGISGAIQHRVGMQAAETIVAVNRDPDAPLAEYADLYAVGDLFEVGPAIVDEIRARRGQGRSDG